MPPKPFLNPYRDAQRVRRLVADVAEQDFLFIYAIRPMKRSGTLQTTINLLWEKLCNECRRRNITDHTKLDEFEHLVANCELRLPDNNGGTGSAVAGPLSNAIAPNVGGRTAGLGSADKNVAQQPTNNAGRVGARGRRVKGKGAK